MFALCWFSCCVQAVGATASAASLACDTFTNNLYHPGKTLSIHRNLPADCWPQLANTPQRTSYTPMTFAPAQGQKKWVVCLTELDLGNRINATVQPIIAEGLVYVGCKNGKLFALDARTGEVKWIFQAGGPICHTAGYAKGRTMVAAMDGCVYAVHAVSGKQEWVFSNQSPGRRHYGFSTAVLLAEERLFAVDRGGRLFALDPQDGRELWHYDADAPVDQSPAYDAGTVFFASEDMRVHAVKAADGAPRWQSEQLAGLSFRWFHPVVVNGLVLVRSLCGTGGVCDNANPLTRTLFALDEPTGRQRVVLPQRSMGHDGTQPPPAVTRDGLLIVQWQYQTPDPLFCWVMEDPQTQQIILPLLETTQRAPNPHSKDPWWAGLYAPNENAIVSVIGECVMVAHPIGFYGQGYCGPLGGMFDLAKRQWHIDMHGFLPDGDGKGPGGWVYSGTDGNESGGSSGMSAAAGLMYHHDKRFHRITCYEPMPSAAPGRKTP